MDFSESKDSKDDCGDEKNPPRSSETNEPEETVTKISPNISPIRNPGQNVESVSKIRNRSSSDEEYLLLSDCMSDVDCNEPSSSRRRLLKKSKVDDVVPISCKRSYVKSKVTHHSGSKDSESPGTSRMTLSPSQPTQPEATKRDAPPLITPRLVISSPTDVPSGISENLPQPLMNAESPELLGKRLAVPSSSRSRRSRSPSPVPSRSSRMQSSPPVPSRASRMHSSPPVPSRASRMHSSPPVPSRASRMQSSPPVPSRASRMQSSPPVPSRESRLQSPPPVPSRASRLQPSPPVPSRASRLQPSPSVPSRSLLPLQHQTESEEALPLLLPRASRIISDPLTPPLPDSLASYTSGQSVRPKIRRPNFDKESKSRTSIHQDEGDRPETRESNLSEAGSSGSSSTLRTEIDRNVHSCRESISSSSMLGESSVPSVSEKSSISLESSRSRSNETFPKTGFPLQDQAMSLPIETSEINCCSTGNCCYLGMDENCSRRCHSCIVINCRTHCKSHCIKHCSLHICATLLKTLCTAE